ncbi:hypothetical protein LXL04_028927 [Taraxacum kok-saghyz]
MDQVRMIKFGEKNLGRGSSSIADSKNLHSDFCKVYATMDGSNEESSAIGINEPGIVAYSTMDGSNEESSAIGINEPGIVDNFAILISNCRGGGLIENALNLGKDRVQKNPSLPPSPATIATRPHPSLAAARLNPAITSGPSCFDF